MTSISALKRQNVYISLIINETEGEFFMAKMRLILQPILQELNAKGYQFGPVQTQPYRYEVSGCPKFSFYFERGMLEFFQESYYRLTLKIKNSDRRDIALNNPHVYTLFEEDQNKEMRRIELLNNELVVQHTFFIPPEKVTAEEIDLQFQELAAFTLYALDTHPEFFPMPKKKKKSGFFF